jgi:PAS domain S-box-containing protein
MALHPAERKRHFPEELPVAWDPIRRALEENEDWYRDLIEHSQDLLCVHDLQGRFLSVNPVPARLLGYSVEEMMEKPLRDFIDPQFRSQFDVYLREIERTGESRGLMAVVARSGEQRIWEYHNTLRTEGVAAPIVRGIAHDVTERVRAEKALRASNERLLNTAGERERTIRELTLFRTLLDQSNDAIKVIDPETLRFLDVNQKACAELGYSRDELLSMTVYDIDPNADESLVARVQQQWRDSGFAIVETLHRRKDGTTFPVEVNMRQVRLDREYSVSISRDITERKRTEEALRQSEARERARAKELETVLEAVPVPVCIAHDAECRRMTGNRAAYEQMRLPAGKNISKNAAPEERPTFRLMEDGVEIPTDLLPMQQAAATGEPVYGRALTIVFEDGTERETVVNAVPLLDEEGKPRGVVGASIDLTELKQVEEALRESEARERARARDLETVLEAVPVPIYITQDAECRWMTGNLAAYEQMRVPAGKNMSKSAPPEEQRTEFRLMHDGVEVPTDLLPMQQAAATGKPVYGHPLTTVFEDGTERETVVNAVPLLDEKGKVRGVVASLIDLTEQKQAEKALRESELRFRAVYERSPVGIALMDSRTGRFLQVNPKFCEIAGRREEELLRIDVGSITHPDDVAHGSEYHLQLAEGKLANYDMEKRYLRPDGSVRWVRILVTPMWGKGEKRRWHMALVEDITERRQAEEAISTLVQVRADSSENFFASMAIQLAKCLEADCTLIGELIEGEEDKVRTIGVCGQGVIAENFTYDLAHTPCEGVMGQGSCSYVAGVAEMFPKDVLLKQMRVEGYAGTPLRDSQGRPIGIMAALYTRPLANAKFAEMILQLFSTRTAAEIERKRTEEALRQSEERFRVAIKNSPIAVFNQDRDLRYTWIYNSQFPLPDSEKLGKTLGELLDPAEAAHITEVRRRVLETGVGARDEMRVTFGGKKRYLDTTIEPVLNAAGAVIGITGASMDVTALREASEQLREAKKKLTEEKLYLEQEINAEMGFGEIIGQSKALQAVMEQVGKVAACDATVLLLGETGTGKELVARAIHWLSLRTGNSFIKLNCAAIPSGLLESDLFGHEKGAFTGAVSKKIGRLELADKGTLFLDEIGEISLSLQPKLLRVLQDREFERLGGTQTLKVDFRLIAATNRDLSDSVRENEFRSDLYYRLNVFPIRVPPLRERREDIRFLVEHFVQKFARRMKKSITSIPKRTIDALMGWEWPGNVRELENFIERSVILTQGSVLVSPLSELKPTTAEEKSVDESLEATEREHILRALRESHGQIGGLKGAAMRLGLKRTTLQSKLKHFGIDPRSGSPEH